MGRFGITPVKTARSWGTLVLAILLLAACSGGTNTAQNETTRNETTRSETTVEQTGPDEAGRKNEVEKPAKEKDAGERRVAKKRMSLRDAVGQMFVVSVGGTTPDRHIEEMIRERNIGGVLLFANNMATRAQTKRLTGSLQRLSMRTEPSMPLFVAVDQEGGEV